MEFVFLLLCLPVTHSVKHSLTYFLTTSSGLQTFPEFVDVSVVDGVQVGYCDSDMKRPQHKHDWVKQLVEDYPQHMEWQTVICVGAHQVSKADTESIKHHFNQTGGVHVFQRMAGCEWDDENGTCDGYQRFGYDGEDFITLDLKHLNWVYTKLASSYKHKWDIHNDRLHAIDKILTSICPVALKRYWDYGKTFLERKVLPSVSLLQKTPSSPLSCHATGFYPDRADMFWRKDGEELHEDVERGEILPNHDGTFQMRVVLNISSAEDWGRYDCVFHLSGVEDNIVTKLDKAVIRTNWVPPSEVPAAPVVGAVVGLLLLALCISGLFIWRRRNNKDYVRAVTVEAKPPLYEEQHLERTAAAVQLFLKIAGGERRRQLLLPETET